MMDEVMTFFGRRGGVLESDFRKEFPHSFTTAVLDAVERCCQKGYLKRIESDSTWLVCTPEGVAFYNGQ